MIIGILKESQNENRVAMIPETVAALVELKASVLVEKEAGAGTFSSDAGYQDAGAKVMSREQVIKESDLLVKVNPIDPSEVKGLKKKQVLISIMNPFQNMEMVKALKDQNITSFGLDIIPRTTRAQAMDVLSSQATVAGYKAVLDAATRLPNFMMMFMSAAGTIKPSKILILGAGVAGLQAVATARKLGAVVEVFDVRAAVKEEVMSLGAKFVEVEGARDDSQAGGYAVEQSDEFKRLQQEAIHNHSAGADVVICTAQIPGKKAPILVKKETVDAMKPGSIIIDLAASTGGNCELTKSGEVVDHNGVSIVGNSTYPSELPLDASRMFGKNLLNFLKLIINEDGNLNLNFEDELVSGTCLTHHQEIVHERVKETLK